MYISKSFFVKISCLKWNLFKNNNVKTDILVILLIPVYRSEDFILKSKW